MSKYRAGLTALGISVAIAGCGSSHNNVGMEGRPSAPVKRTRPISPNAMSSTKEARKLAQAPKLANSLLSGPLAKLDTQIHHTRTSQRGKNTTLEYIRTDVCAIVGRKLGEKALTFYIANPAYVYRAYPSHPNLVLGTLAGVDETGYLIHGTEIIVDLQTGQSFTVKGPEKEIDITDSSPNLELQPVHLRSDNEVFNTHGQRVMSLAGYGLTSENLVQVANDPLTELACFGNEPPVQPGSSQNPSPLA